MTAVTAGRHGLLAILVVLGIGWGLTIPLTKIAVSEGYRQFGLIFWQQVIGAFVLGGICWARGRLFWPNLAQIRLFIVVALLGTLLPNAASYTAAVYLPAGIMSIVIATVPLFAFPIALGLGLDRFDGLRMLGLLCGLAGVILLVAPAASLPDRSMVWFVPLALIAPFFYGVEGNYVAKWGTAGLGPIQTLFGASVVGGCIALPLAIGSGQWIDPRLPWGAPDLALVAASFIHALVYSSYVWLVSRAGSVFASQVAYLVTGFGMVWAMVLLKETYTNYVWLALVIMLLGVFLVQPRRSRPLAPD